MEYGYEDKDEVNSIATSSAMDIFTKQYNPPSALLEERWNDDEETDPPKIERIRLMSQWESDYRKASVKHFIGSKASRAQGWPSYFDPKEVLMKTDEDVLSVVPSPAMLNQYYSWKTTDIEDSLTKIYASFGIGIYWNGDIHYTTPNFSSMWIIAIDPVTSHKEVVCGFWIRRYYDWWFGDKSAYISGCFDF